MGATQLELGNFKVQRRVRVWERLASVVVVIALVSVLVSGRRGWTSPSEWKEGVRSPVKKVGRALLMIDAAANSLYAVGCSHYELQSHYTRFGRI